MILLYYQIKENIQKSFIHLVKKKLILKSRRKVLQIKECLFL